MLNILGKIFCRHCVFKYFFLFSQKTELDILRRQYAWNGKSCFLWKIRKKLLICYLWISWECDKEFYYIAINIKWLKWTIKSEEQWWQFSQYQHVILELHAFFRSVMLVCQPLTNLKLYYHCGMLTLYDLWRHFHLMSWNMTSLWTKAS